ncbi:MAG: squalene/phytoene synthase family protein [Gammaproteobacteria bacterium]|nr:squalene/phytoene synthase family protein [Gammaproteobacteria bacterium]
MSAPESMTDQQYQDFILQGVSRTFALTIPQLPPPLDRVVGNAYLLCRIADTIEDDPDLAFEHKKAFSLRFVALVREGGDSGTFASELGAALSPRATPAEHDLIRNTPRVLRITHACNANQRHAMARCVEIMADGMVRYQGTETLAGLTNQRAMDHYCYYVAGVVGEMLTDLFCDFAPDIAANKTALDRLAISFGQGLQMTNILKDIWEDRSRGACWLPRDRFAAHGVNLLSLDPSASQPQFEAALGELIGIAHGHLQNALHYTLLIPARHRGIRRFCLWALGMAVLTLRKLNQHRDFRHGSEVKISRRAVKTTIVLCNAGAGSAVALKTLFSVASIGVPHSDIEPPAAPRAD